MEKSIQLQKLWTTFFELINYLNEPECNSVEFDCRTKTWVRLFTSLYQSKDVTPYMHAFAMHVSQFIDLHGNITMFTQQGLEKLNDLTTIHFQRSSNHRNTDALRQILEKWNHIENLEDSGYQITKSEQKCSNCQLTGHNKRTCPKNHHTI